DGWRRTRLRGMSKLARPYLLRLIIFLLLTAPSVGPLLEGRVSPAMTAAWSCRSAPRQRLRQHQPDERQCDVPCACCHLRIARPEAWCIRAAVARQSELVHSCVAIKRGSN